MLRSLLLFTCLLTASCTPYKTNYSTSNIPRLKYGQNLSDFNSAQSGLRPRQIAKKIKISNVNYQLLSDQRGFWTGVMEGDGNCNLRLNFYQKKRLIKSKNIGSRLITTKDGPVWFKFQSNFPKAKFDNWKIEAYQN